LRATQCSTKRRSEKNAMQIHRQNMNILIRGLLVKEYASDGSECGSRAPWHGASGIEWRIMSVQGEPVRSVALDASARTDLDLADVRRRLKSIFIGSMGNLVEWYDFYAYTAFALYFAPKFFPHSDPVVQQLEAAVLFAATFLMGPFGGWLFGLWPTATAGARR
jgi:hypothetical protein